MTCWMRSTVLIPVKLSPHSVSELMNCWRISSILNWNASVQGICWVGIWMRIREGFCTATSWKSWDTVTMTARHISCLKNFYMTAGILWNSATILSRYKKPAKANGPVGINISLERSRSGECWNHSPGGMGRRRYRNTFLIYCSFNIIGQTRKWESAVSFPWTLI